MPNIVLHNKLTAPNRGHDRCSFHLVLVWLHGVLCDFDAGHLIFIKQIIILKSRTSILIVKKSAPQVHKLIGDGGKHRRYVF